MSENRTEVEELGKRAKAAQPLLGKLGSEEKNRGLKAAAQAILFRADEILEANERDRKQALERGMSPALIDRLTLTKERIEAIAEGMKQIAELEDPIGEVIGMKKRPNGLLIGQKRVPIGVIAVIYEARPNVTADAFALCFKTGNAVILKGGRDALCSNKKIVEIIQYALLQESLPPDALLLLASADHELTKKLMRMNSYIDVIIPRGSAGLIRTVVETSTIPVIETGTGNCHIYVDESADFKMALDIIENAKTQRIGVCNACESLVIHEANAALFLPLLAERMKELGVEVRADEKALSFVPYWKRAEEEDWGKEYLDYIISVKLVSDLEEAIIHINRYNTGHSESILTNSYENAERFLNEIDAAAVYVNASTRFTDGFEFGFGAEIGISTQKLHARGPMGLKELTCLKYIIYGNGQIRK